MISTSEADRLIDEAFASHHKARPPTQAPVALSIGCLLARDVFADADQPPFDRVAMDGIAIKLGDGAGDVNGVRSTAARTNFHIDGRLPAGVAMPEGLARPLPGNAIEVMTGAALPSPWNAVVPWEDLEPGGDGTQRRLRAGARLLCGMNIHKRASDYRKGDLLIASGTRISAPHVHILASVGCAVVPIVPFPRISLVATGDELVAVNAAPAPWQIRTSNMVALEACLRRAGFSVGNVTHLPDREESLRSGLADALATSDVLLLSGGVSKGSKDFVPMVLSSLGCTRVFHGIAQKPGKPLWFGVPPQGGMIFALPGNPVSSLVCFVRYVLPRLRAWGETGPAGQSPAGALTLPLAERAEVKPDCALFLPATVELRPDGIQAARLRESKGSGNFAGLLPSDGIAEVLPGRTILPEGAPIRFFPWP